MSQYHPIVQRLLLLIEEHEADNWRSRFEQAIASVQSYNIALIRQVNSFEDYIDWINRLLYWRPTENKQGNNIYNHQNAFYFFLDQKPLQDLQNEVVPAPRQPDLRPLSQWMVDYVNALGQFLDTEDSIDIETLRTFQESPTFNFDEYLPPPSGYKTFNQFFARHEKPGMRPVAAMGDHSVIVNSADSIFQGWWQINERSRITVKTLDWSIYELLEGSPYRDRFKGGIFMHGWLNVSDSHRLMAPAAGRVLESRVVLGQVYRNVVPEPVANSTTNEHVLKSVGISGTAATAADTLAVQNTPGYQFAQARGLIILDTSIGLVGVIPVGMGFVSSIVMTAEPGKTVYKGEEICYVQFGGSDHIILFEAASCVSLTAQVNVHYQKGQVLGYAYPVLGVKGV